jgi:hypothetical protein
MKQKLLKKRRGGKRGRKGNRNLEMGSLKSKTGLSGQGDYDTEASDSSTPKNYNMNFGYGA